MFYIIQKQEQYLNYYLVDTQADSMCAITPGKGGMCTSFIVRGEEMLYRNEENYFSEQRTRCAMPILFPTTGLCEQDTVWIEGAPYPMGIHGFAHAQSWSVVHQTCEDGAELTLRLEANEETLRSYPFHFTYDLTYRLKGTSLSLQVRIHNHEDYQMPFTFGFHPYFKVSDVRNLAFDIPCEVIQNEQGVFVSCQDIQFPYATETKVTLGGTTSPCSFVDRETGRRISIRYGNDVHYVILWSLCEQNFLCMEPWNSLPNGLNEGQGECLKPHKDYTTEMIITIQ